MKHNCLSIFAVFSLVVITTIFSAATAHADASDVLAKIKERAQARSEIIDIIRSSDDTSLRIAAFEEAVKADDPELRLSALTAAFQSDEVRLRKAAMRHYLNSSKAIRVDFVLPDDASVIQQKFYSSFQGQQLKNLKVDPANDSIDIDDRFWSGQLIDDGFDMTFQRAGFANCSLDMRLATPTTMSGNMECILFNGRWLRETEGEDRMTLAATVNLQ